MPEDSVSLITFNGRRHVWIFRDMPGVSAREAIGRLLGTLYAVVKVSQRSAVEEALKHLERDPKPGENSAVLILSAAADDDTLDHWVEQIRADPASERRVLMIASDSGEGVP